MTPAALVWRLERHDSLDSTSTRCRDLAALGGAGGLAVIAGRQTAGRGTNGRVWSSPEGNLYLSALLRPRMAVRDVPQLSRLAGIALIEALQPWSPVPLTLKWPNDILRDGAKLAGVLVESATDGARLDWVVIGMGVNLAVAPALADRPTACLGPLDPVMVAEAILARLAHWVGRVERDGVSALPEPADVTQGGALAAGG